MFPLWNPLWLWGVALWLRNVAMWLYGYMAMWLFGDVAMCLRGHVAMFANYRILKASKFQHYKIVVV